MTNVQTLLSLKSDNAVELRVDGPSLHARWLIDEARRAGFTGILVMRCGDSWPDTAYRRHVLIRKDGTTGTVDEILQFLDSHEGIRVVA